MSVPGLDGLAAVPADLAMSRFDEDVTALNAAVEPLGRIADRVPLRNRKA